MGRKKKTPPMTVDFTRAQGMQMTVDLARAQEMQAQLTDLIAADRQHGFTLWQVLIWCRTMPQHGWLAITADPIPFIQRARDQAPDWVRQVTDAFGVMVLPLDFTDASEEQLAAIVTLPRDQFLSSETLRESGAVMLSPQECPGLLDLIAAFRDATVKRD